MNVGIGGCAPPQPKPSQNNENHDPDAILIEVQRILEQPVRA